ncbi:hypothetical protein ACO22_01112 [Paracoccidioides brasiliensis]|uniref:Uncharacterized protein n=1 Tax=Paracoccidioides brasiliensis TaxID=121759 RepID=A0A1D2JML3_PARBR|nr:hypothetical protein ACO22_01112 [Paracoccidioides brasiliensis]
MAGLHRRNCSHAASMNSIITISYSNGANPPSKEEANAKIQSQLLKQVQLSNSGIVPTIEAIANERMMNELMGGGPVGSFSLMFGVGSIRRISFRSILIADKQILKSYYFENTHIIPKYLNVDEINEDGLSVKHDISCFSSLIYNTVTGRKFEVPICQLSNPTVQGCREDAAVFKIMTYTIPEHMDKDIHERLPNIVDIFMGDIIRDCWDRDGHQRREDGCSELSELSESDLSGISPTDAHRLGYPVIIHETEIGK